MFLMYSLYHALGPATWAKAFPIANGKKQSPIDITPGTATFDAKLAGGPLVTNYAAGTLQAKNTGKTMTVHGTQSGM